MKNKSKLHVAVIGATGAVGREMVSILEERKFPVDQLFLYASEKSVGQTVEFRGKPCGVRALNAETLKDFKSIRIALMSAGASVSREFAPKIVREGAVCIDNSAAWRMDSDVPLVVPEVNYHDLSLFSRKRIVANPNCSTTQLVQVLKPIHDEFRVKRVVVSTYQAAAGKGDGGIRELAEQTASILNQKKIVIEEFPHQIAFNCIPHIGDFLENGYTVEEMKMIEETQKIMNAPEMRVSATCVRVPVFYGHSESVNIETERKTNAAEIRKLLSRQKGVKVVDNPKKNLYPLNIEAAGSDETFVGRIREDLSRKDLSMKNRGRNGENRTTGIDLWIVSDSLRKGAALNAVQIAEVLTDEFL